jgi:hypothetical protein
MLPNERNQLLRRYQKSDCVNKTKQPQNYKTRQPIGISQCKETLKRILLIHLSPRQQVSNFEHAMKLAIGNRNSGDCQGKIRQSQPTSKAFGAALLLQMVDCELRILLFLQCPFNPSRLCQGFDLFACHKLKVLSRPFRGMRMATSMLGNPCMEINRRADVVSSRRSTMM